MKSSFGFLSDGREASLYTLQCGQLTATVTDYGATLVSLLVPDRDGQAADVVLGYDDAAGYEAGGSFFGAPVGRNANRIAGASFELDGRVYPLVDNDNGNNLHSGPDFISKRMWEVIHADDSRITLQLHSPDGDQGYPGNATIRVSYTLEAKGIRISYDATCDKDTLCNYTNHSFFNLAGQDQPLKAIDQMLCMPARCFSVADEICVPTGEMRSVEGTPMDFRVPKPISRDIGCDYAPLHLQGGYDHNFEVFAQPCAILSDPDSGRSMAVLTDLPGVQLYTGNFLTGEIGKGGVCYGHRAGICLETQFYPDALHKPQWAQPIMKAGENYHSETCYIFSW